MKIHRNARLTLIRRVELVQRIAAVGVGVAAAEFAVSRQTAGLWWERHQAAPDRPLLDHSSRPHRTQAVLTAEQQAQILTLRAARKPQWAIAIEIKAHRSTVQRFCKAQGVNRLPPLQAPVPIVRYERERPGEMLHLDIKTLGCIVKPGHRVTGNPRDHVPGAGNECVHIAIDDHSRLSFSQVLPDQTTASALLFLKAALAFYKDHGVTVERIYTDNGSAYRSKDYVAQCAALGMKKRYTKPYTPRTNGKAERFIQTALKEWAYAKSYNTSAERTAALQPWSDFYNTQRPHSALNYKPPISRIPNDKVKNVLNLNT